MATLKELYRALRADGAPLPDTYEAFRDYMTSGPNNGYDHRKEVYDALKADGAPLPDKYETFSNALFKAKGTGAAMDETQDRQTRMSGRSFYRNIIPWEGESEKESEGGAEALSRNQAAGQAATTAPVGNIGTAPAGKTATEQGRWQPSVQEKIRMMDDLNSSVADHNKRTQDIIGRGRLVVERSTAEGRRKAQNAKMAAQIAGAPSDVLGLTPPPPQDAEEAGGGGSQNAQAAQSPVPYGVKYVDGKPVTEWLLPDGSLTTNIVEADQAEFAARNVRLRHEFEKRMREAGLNPEDDVDVNMQLVDERLADVDRRLAKAEKGRVEAEREFAEKNPFTSMYAGSVGAGRQVARNEKRGADIGSLLAERTLLESSRRDLLAAKELRKSGNPESTSMFDGVFDVWNNTKNLGRGIADAFKEPGLYTFGLSDVNEASNLLAIKNRLDRGEELTDTELNMAMSAALAHQGSQAASDRQPSGYTGGKVIGEMGPFMAQMAANPLSGLGRGLARQAVRKFGREGVKAVLARGAARVVGDVAAASFLTNTLQMPTTAADIMKRRAGDVVADDNGVSFVGGESWAKAIAKGEGASVIENFTEYMGEHVFAALGKPIVRAGASVADKTRLGRTVTEFINRVSASDLSKTISTIESRAQWSGTIPEIMEEEIGIVLNSATVGDNSLSDLADPREQANILIGCGAFGGFVSGLKTAGYGARRYYEGSMLHRSELVASVALGNDWADMRRRIEETDEEGLVDILAEVLAEVPAGKRSKEAAKAVGNYIVDLQRYRGYNIAMAKRRMEGLVDEVEEQLGQSSDAGYSASAPGEMQAAHNMYEHQRKRAEGIFVPQLLDMLDSDPAGTLMDMRQRGGFTPEEMGAALDYANAKAVRDGIIQRVNDMIGERISLSDATVDSRVNDVTGMIQPAVIGGAEDRNVYIVSGKIVLTDDGAVDRRASDATLVVRDAETGALEFTSPESIISVGEPLDPSAQKQAAGDEIRRQTAQAAVDALNGIRHRFALNDEFTILDDGGTPVRGIVTGELDEDGMVEVYTEVPVNGNVVNCFSPSELEGMLQTYNGEGTPGATETPAEADGPGQKGTESGEISANDTEGAEASSASASPREEKAEETRSASASPQGERQATELTPLQRIPRDEKGEPLFEQAENPEAGWDALVEDNEGDVADAKETADMMVEQKRKAYESAKKQKPTGTTPAKIKDSRKKIKARLAQAKQEYEMWQQIAGVEQRRQDAIREQQEAEARRAEQERSMEEARKTAELARAAAERAEADKANMALREEAERLEREALEGIPEWHLDSPENARNRGARRFGGQMFSRQEPVQGVMGKEVEVKFSQKDLPKGKVTVIEASQLQPSHLQGQRNPMFFIDEAQPKNRAEAVSKNAAREMAEGIRPEEITGSATAYTGAPTVNARGEVIQGNNRSDALRFLWDNHLPEQQQVYKQYLIDNAERFGLDPEAIKKMHNPVLVNMLDVDDAEAIRLGQMTAQDTESGGIERIKPKNVAQKLGEDMRLFANQLLESSDEEATFGQLVDRNGTDVLKWMVQKGAITDTQYQSAFDSKGNLTAEAKNDLQKVLYQAVFKGGSLQLEEMFDALPSKAQRAILSTAFRDMDSPNAGKMLPEIQASIIAYKEMMTDPAFVNAKKLEDVLRAVEGWKRQTALDDRFEQYFPSDNFSNFALHLAAIYKASDMSQTTIAGYFNRMYDLAQGKKVASLFEEADTTQYPLADVIKQVLNIDYKPAKNGNRNVANGGADVALRNSVGQGGELRGNEPPASGEQNPTGTEPSDGGAGTSGDSRGVGERRNLQPSEKRTEGETSEIDENGLPFVVSENGTTSFGVIREESGLPSASIKLSEGYQDENGKGYGLRHIEAGHGDEIRNAGFSTVEEFVSYVAKNYDEDNIRVGKQRRNGNTTYLIQVTDSHDNTLFIELSRDGSYWNVNSGGVFRKGYSNKKETVAKTEPQQPNNAVSSDSSLSTDEQSGTSSIEPNGESTVSERKVNDSASEKQADGGKSSVQPSGSKGEDASEARRRIVDELNTALEWINSKHGTNYSDIDSLIKWAARKNMGIRSLYRIADENLYPSDATDFKRNLRTYLKILNSRPNGSDSSSNKREELRPEVKQETDGSVMKPESTGNKPSFLDAVKTLYNKGKAVASALYQRAFFDVAKTPDFMKQYGLTGETFTIGYGVIARHFGKDSSHDISEAEWKRLPEALTNPFAITRFKDKRNGFRLYTRLQNNRGEYVVVGIDVKNAGRNLEVNSIATLFGRRDEAGLTLKEELIYTDSKITPEQKALLDGPNSHRYLSEREHSERKVNDSASEKQADGGKSSVQPSGSKGEQTIQTSVEAASAQVNTEPTEAQKKAGNYKMGHVEIDGLQVTIENPKGSMRRGKDADGTPWETEMKNTYGYIKGTTGKDGDKIDVFLSDNPAEGDVYVVDQYNKDGSFDEHKVMYGFTSVTEAEAAYLSNYSADWAKGRKVVVTGVTRGEFKKWLDASNRKTKPFADYKSVKAIEVKDDASSASASAREERDGPKMSVGNGVDGNSDVYEVTKEMLESAGIEVIEVGDEEAREKLDSRTGDEKLMGSRTDRKMDKIAEHYAGKQLDENQQAAVDVFSGKRDNVAIEVERADGKKRVVMRQGKESKAGTKHSLFRHFETSSNYITADDIAMIPEIIAKGERVVDGNRIAYEYTNKDGSKLKVTTEVHGEKERFTNLFSNRKPQQQKRAENTQLSAPRSGAEVSDTKVDEKFQIGKPEKQESSSGLSQEEARELDARYIEAVNRGDMETAQAMVNEAAERAGYSSDSDYQGTSAFNGAAPYNGYGLSKKERKEQWDNGDFEGDWTLGDQIDGMDNGNLEFLLFNPNGERSLSAFGRESARALRQAYQNPKRKITVYRSVPSDVKERSLRDGDWVSPSLSYAKDNAAVHGWGRNYRIIEQEVDVDELWWDGNDINEWGYDSGSNMAYRNTKNNRKLLDAVTYDDKGNVIPLSKRFDIRKNDVRFLRRPDGVVYGWTQGGKVYLNRDAMNPETPLHEYTHLWDDMVRRENPELWARGVELMKQTPVWQEVLNDPNYADIRDDEDAVASEVHSRLTGRDGARLMEEMIGNARKEGVVETAKAVTLVERLKHWLGEMFKGLKKTLSKWSKRDLENLTVDDFNRMTIRDLAEGIDPRSGGKSLVAVHNLSEEKLRSALELGGFPMPSIAVTKAGTGHGEYGGISLVFGKESIDPSDRRNKVYSGDAWTPTFPQIGYKFNSGKTSEIYARANKALGMGLPLFRAVDFHPDNYERRINDRDRSLVEAFRNDYGAKQLFLFEKGNPVKEYEKREVDKYSPENVRLFDKILKAIGEDRLRNERIETIETEIKRIISEHTGKDVDSMKPLLAKIRVSNTIRKALDYAENGNKKTETDIEATQAKIDSRVDSKEKEYESWLEDMFAGIVEKSGIRNDTDLFTPSGKSRKWESLYDALTLDNVVRAMKRQAEKGGHGLFGGSIFGASTNELNDIGELRREAEERIKSLPKEEYDAERKRIEERLEKVSLPSVSRSFPDAMDFVENVREAVAKTQTAEGIYRNLRKIYPDMTMDVAEEIADIVRDIQKMSTRYFEAKPQRAVGFEEVRLAVVPEGTPEDIVSELEKRGIPVNMYKSGDERQRSSIISRETSEMGIRFHAAMARGREEFDRRRERAVAERGIVMPGLNQKEVRVVDVPRHDFTGTGKEALKAAEKWAKENIVGIHQATDSRGDKFDYSISNDAVEKYVSRSATDKSENIGVHLAALKKLTDIISESIEVEVHPDYMKLDGIRKYDNKINPESLVHRFYGAVNIEGKMYRIKTTMREYQDANRSPLAHSYQITQIELLEAPSDGVVSNSGEHLAMTSNSSKVEPTATGYHGQLPRGTAKLLKGVEKSYDPGKKLLDESEKDLEYRTPEEGIEYVNARAIQPWAAPLDPTVLQESKLSDVSADEAEDDVLCRPVTDKATLDRLNNEPTIKVYRAMQMIDGGLRPPMSGKVNGQWRDATEVGVWEEAEEHPELADENGRFKLDKGNGKSIKAAYNPYIHTSRSPINDQFSSAWSRPELVTVEVEVPVSELSIGYKAEKAKNSVGELEWKSGPVSRALAKIGQARRVILSRWSRVLRVVPVEEVAEAYAQRLNAYGIEVPFNTVPPALRDALAERGVKIGKPEKGNAGAASRSAFEQWINEQERQRMGDGYGVYTDSEVSFLNDLVSRITGKNRFSRKRQAEFAARERQRMAARIRELAGRMHLDNVEILTDASQLEGKRAKAKGFYNKRTGKITIVIPNNYGTIDAEQTLLHEAVAHYGLRQLFGRQFDAFLDNAYEAADPEIRGRIAGMAAQNGWDFRTATEEYLAGLAEDMDFEDTQRISGWWLRIKSLFLDMLEKIGFEGFRDKTGVVIGDNELRYLLWRSYENLTEPGRRRSILGEAEDVAMQFELKVGNYADGGIEAEYAAEPLSAANDSFNKQLSRYIAGEMPKHELIQLGFAAGVMKAFLPAVPIVMRQRILNKASETKHNVDLAALRDLPDKISHPIFVFQRDSSTIGILTEIKDREGKNVCVAIELNRTIQDGGEVLAVNDVRSIHGRDVANVILPILHNDTLRYVDKAKGLAWLSSASSNYQQEIAMQDLEDVAKIVKSFENPTIEEEELFRPGDFTPRDKVLARDAYNRVCASGSYQFKEAVQDSMLGLKELYKAVLGKKTRIEDVAGFENAYLYENRMSSMNSGEQHEYFIRYMKPLLKEIGKICGANNRKRMELTDYMMARHGLERNAYMRKEALKKGDDTDRDFSGLTGLTGEADWRGAEATARQWVDDYEKTVDTAGLWKAVNAATKATLEKVYLSGIISKETYEKTRDMYEYYIPLRGWDETTSEQVYGYLTSREGSLNGSIMKRAEGRGGKSDDPIATIAMMADDAIRQGNRNLMRQRFLNFVMNHPSDVVSVHDIWLEYDDVADEWRPVFADVDNRDSAEEVEKKIEAFEARMEALRQAKPDKYKSGREAQDIPYKVVKGNLREHQVLVRRGGRTFVVTINGNPRAAQALNGLTNPDVDTNGVVGDMLKGMEWVNRQLSAFYTTRNPDFVISNFFRDMLYSNCMMWVKESPRYALHFHKNFGKFFPVSPRRFVGFRKGLGRGTVYSMGMLLRKWENGTLDMNDKYEAMFYQFMKNGGETGYTNVKDLEGHKRNVAAELKKQGSVGRKAWSALGMQLDLLNRSAENCARFAAFVTSREFGRSIDRAIYDAKEVSVNFNKKGSGSKMLKATGQTFLGNLGVRIGGAGRIAYVFWNAGIQGMTNFGRLAKRHPAKFMAGAASMFSLGMLIPLLAQCGGDDDDKNAYYNLPEYIRRSNICFKAGGQWITIPLPIEHRAMYGIGELAYGVISGREHYSNKELAYQIAAQVSQVLPLDMLEGGGGISPLIPSAFKPFTEAYIMNKSWSGLPIYRDTPFNKNDPEWTKAYANTDKHLVDFAKWLNETTGGNDFKKGFIDINAARVEYMLGGIFGGVFTFPDKIKKSIETAFGKRDFEWRNIPFANRLVKSGDERTANRKLLNEYFKYMEEYKETGRLKRRYEKAKEDGIVEYARYIDLLENSDEYLRYEIFDEFKDEIDAYRKNVSEETDKEEKKKLEAEMYVLMRSLVDVLHEPEKYYKDDE